MDKARDEYTSYLLLVVQHPHISFRALYGYDVATGRVDKIVGKGPASLTNFKHIGGFFKYETGSRSFVQLRTKHLAPTVDAVVIHPDYLRKRKQARMFAAAGRSSGAQAGASTP